MVGETRVAELLLPLLSPNQEQTNTGRIGQPLSKLVAYWRQRRTVIVTGVA